MYEHYCKYLSFTIYRQDRLSPISALIYTERQKNLSLLQSDTLKIRSIKYNELYLDTD